MHFATLLGEGAGGKNELWCCNDDDLLMLAAAILLVDAVTVVVVGVADVVEVREAADAVDEGVLLLDL